MDSRISFSGGGPYQDGDHLADCLEGWFKGRAHITSSSGSLDGWDLEVTYPGRPIPESFLESLMTYLGNTQEDPSQVHGRMDYVDHLGQPRHHYF